MNSKADLEHLVRVENDGKKVSDLVSQKTSKMETKIGETERSVGEVKHMFAGLESSVKETNNESKRLE